VNDTTIFGIELGLFVAEFGILVTAASAAVGIWIERDREKSLRNPITLTIFVFFAAALGMYQCRQEDAEQAELEDDLAKILEQLDQVANKSEVDMPDLNDLLKAEVMIHGRANPRVLMSLAKRIAANGGDPLVVLASYLPEADLQAMRREGRFDEAMEALQANNENPAAVPTSRPKLTFGSGVSHLRADEPPPPVEDAGPDAAAPWGNGDAGAPDADAPDADAPDADALDAAIDAAPSDGGYHDAGHDAGRKFGKLSKPDDDDDDDSPNRVYEKALEELKAQKTDAGKPSP